MTTSLALLLRQVEKHTSVSTYQITVPVFTRTIGNIAAFLKKGEEFAKINGISKALTPDMFNLKKLLLP